MRIPLLFLLVGFAICKSGTCSAQDSNKIKIPEVPIELGKVEVVNGEFVVTKLVFRYETKTRKVKERVLVRKKRPDNTFYDVEADVEREVSYVVRVPSIYKAFEKDGEISFSTIAGKRVDDVDAVRKLIAKKERPAIVLFHGDTVDPELSKYFIPETVIVVHVPFRAPPRMVAPSGGSGAAPAPAPPIEKFAGQKSQIGIEIDVAQLLKNKTTAELLLANSDLKPFVQDMIKASLYLSLPDSRSKMDAPDSILFHAKFLLKSEEMCGKFFAKLLEGAKSVQVEKRGRTYRKFAINKTQTVYLVRTAKSIDILTEKYVDSDAPSFATDNLKNALQPVATGVPIRMAIDLQGMKGLLGELAAEVQQVKPFTKASSVIIEGGGANDLLFRIQIATPDNSTAKKAKSSMQFLAAGVAAITPARLPSIEDAPATNDFVSHLLTSLQPKVDGTSVNIVVNKPDNFDQLVQDMVKEAQAKR